MAFFATIHEGIVANVEVVSDEVATDETAGREFLASLYGQDPSAFVETYLTEETPYPRGKFAGIGDIFDPVNDVFYTPMPAETETDNG